METSGGKPDLKKLAKAGRIKLAPDGEVVGQATNKVIHVDKRPIKVQDVVVGHKEIPVYGGHATMGDSVWRVALQGPTKYHQKILNDNKRKELHGETGFRPSAPELTNEEAQEYLDYKKFLAENNVEISTDAEFYAGKTKGKPGRPKTV